MLITVVGLITPVYAQFDSQALHSRIQPRKILPQDRNGQESSVFTISQNDTSVLWLEGFESEQVPWYGGFGWGLDSTQSFRGDWSVSIDDTTAGVLSQLVSPRIDLTDVAESEKVFFSFAVNADMPDFDGDGDSVLDDYYWIDVADYSSHYWHTSQRYAYSGSAWWCANPDSGGYENDWLQYLDSPQISIPDTIGNVALSFKLRYALEEPGTYGWDGANVRLSTDDGESWEVLEGTPEYDFSVGFAWHYHGEGVEIPGWAGQSDQWIDASFDLSGYTGETVIIRFAFGSDLTMDISADSTLTGVAIDNILVAGDPDTLFYDNADDMQSLQPAGFTWTEHLYDYGGSGSGRPGAEGWEEYLPGMPFSEGQGLDLNAYKGTSVKLRWVAVTDTNQDGGDGEGLFLDDVQVFKHTTDVGVEQASGLPHAVRLMPNYPNPFNPATTVTFAIPGKSDVTLTIYDQRGREVARLADGMMEAGVHRMRWDASALPSGIYFCRLEAGEIRRSQKMVLVK